MKSPIYRTFHWSRIMLKKIAPVIISLFLGITIGMRQISADEVTYQILKFGTQELSYASAYFVNPGEVNVVDNQFKTTLTIKTDHTLGRFPVKIITIDGQEPHVTQTTQNNIDFYTFDFVSKDLTHNIDGRMTVDVDTLNYHHQYDFNLKINKDQLPTVSAVDSDNNKSSSEAITTSTKQQGLKSSDYASETHNTVPSIASTSTQLASSQQPIIKKDNKRTTSSENQLWMFGIAGGLSGLIGVCCLSYFKRRLK